MGIFDRAREAPRERSDTVDTVVDRAAGGSDRRTGGQRRSGIDRGADLAEDELDGHARRGTTPERGTKH